jgi:hypothetical protein
MRWAELNRSLPYKGRREQGASSRAYFFWFYRIHRIDANTFSACPPITAWSQTFGYRGGIYQLEAKARLCLLRRRRKENNNGNTATTTRSAPVGAAHQGVGEGVKG